MTISQNQPRAEDHIGDPCRQQMKAGDESEVFSDYRDFGGWLMSTRTAHKSADGMQTETTTSVSFDDVADSVFTLPDAINALLSKKSPG